MRPLLVGLVGLFFSLSATGATLAEAELSPDDVAFNTAVEFVKNKQYPPALEIFGELATHSHHDAQYNLALLLDRGLGTPEDFRTALKWALLARLGDVKRAVKLSTKLSDKLTEDIVLEVYEEVRLFLKERIDTGYQPAIMHYARFHTDILPEPNFDEAYMWYSIGAALGLPGGIAMREETREAVAPENIVALQAQAKLIFSQLSTSVEKSAPAPIEKIEENAIPESLPSAPSSATKDKEA